MNYYAVSHKRIVLNLFTSRIKAIDFLAGRLYQLDDMNIDAMGIIQLPVSSHSEAYRLLSRSGYTLQPGLDTFYHDHPNNIMEV